MAQSPAHKFGQIIGDLLEMAVEPMLRVFAQDHDLYLDKKGHRAARTGTRVRWVDLYGNAHDLDFVLEKNGDEKTIGSPVAFIETAWRRYTKHSRNKAQEIQGAILPLSATHHGSAPFIGVILAGEFTEGALSQLRSLGFSILYFPYELLLSAFQVARIDASFGEDTPDAVIAAKVRAWEGLSREQRFEVADHLLRSNVDAAEVFGRALAQSVARQIEVIRVFPLHGLGTDLLTIDEAIRYIENYEEMGQAHPFLRYEIQIRYNNSDQINGQFADRSEAIRFLQIYRPISPPAVLAEPNP